MSKPSTAPTEPRTLGVLLVHHTASVDLRILRGGELVATYQWPIPLDRGIALLYEPGFPSRRSPVAAFVAAIDRKVGCLGTLVRAPQRKPTRKQTKETNP